MKKSRGYVQMGCGCILLFIAFIVEPIFAFIFIRDTYTLLCRDTTSVRCEARIVDAKTTVGIYRGIDYQLRYEYATASSSTILHGSIVGIDRDIWEKAKKTRNIIIRYNKDNPSTSFPEEQLIRNQRRMPLVLAFLFPIIIGAVPDN